MHKNRSFHRSSCILRIAAAFALIAVLSSCDVLGLASGGGSGSTAGGATDVPLVSFVFLKSDNPALAEDCSAVVGDSGATVAVTHGADVTALMPTIVVGADVTVVPASGTARDFTNPVEYTLTAADGTQRTVTVSVADIGTVTLSGTLRDAVTGGGLEGYTIGWNGEYTDTVADGSYSLQVSKTRSAVVGFFSRYKAGEGGEYKAMKLDLRADATLPLKYQSETASYDDVRRVSFKLYAPTGSDATTQEPIVVGGIAPLVLATIVNGEGGSTVEEECTWAGDNIWYTDTPTFGADCLVYLTVQDNGSGIVMAFSNQGYTQYSRLYTGKDLSAGDGTPIDVYEPADDELAEVSLSFAVDIGSFDLSAPKAKAGKSVAWYLESAAYGDVPLFDPSFVDDEASFPVPKELLALEGYWEYGALTVDSTSLRRCVVQTNPSLLSAASASFTVDLTAAPATLPQATLSDGIISATAVDGVGRYMYVLSDATGDEYFTVTSLEASVALPAWLADQDLVVGSSGAGADPFPEEVSGYQSFDMYALEYSSSAN